jgi:hypothetical protein
MTEPLGRVASHCAHVGETAIVPLAGMKLRGYGRHSTLCARC